MFGRWLLLIAATVVWCAATAAQAQSCATDRWFCVEAFNTGLEAPQRAIDRSTPQATLETFHYLAANDEWTAAAHLLDLQNIPPDEQATVGTELARELHAVIKRATAIDWEELVDRPDAMMTRGPADNPVLGEPRKSVRLWTLTPTDYPVGLRLHRVKPDGENAVWVFAPQTIDHIPALFDRYGPSDLEQMLPAGMSADAVLGLMWWEVFAIPLLLALSLFLGRLAWIGVGYLSKYPERQIRKDILRSMRGPAALAVITSTINLAGSTLFVFSGQITAFLVPATWLGLIGAFLWFVVNGVEAFLDRFVDFTDSDLTGRQEAHHRTIATRVSALRRTIVVGVVIVGASIWLTQTELFQNLGLTLLGTAGAVTLVIAFAARRIVGDIIASLQIALNGSAKIGDRIVFDDQVCHIERINFTYVQMRAWDGTRVIVPVETFLSTTFKNWTMKEPEMLQIIKLRFSHVADVQALRDVFFDLLDKLDQEELGDRDTAFVRVADQDVFGKSVWFGVPCADPNTAWYVACDARERIIDAATDIEQRTDHPVFPDANPAEAA